jgi:hypothetical protein
MLDFVTKGHYRHPLLEFGFATCHDFGIGSCRRVILLETGARAMVAG